MKPHRTANLIKSLSVALIATLALEMGAAQTSKSHKISPSQASAIAVKKHPGKVKGTPKLEHEDGQWQYEVLIQSGKNLWEVNVNADSGKIGSVEKTSAAEEAREAKAEAKGKHKSKKKDDEKDEKDEKGEKD